MARIAVGGLMHETNTFSTVPTRYEDMRVSRGEDILEHRGWAGIRARGHTVLPLFVAHATPSGRLTRPAFERLLGELLRELERSLPLHGVLLVLHGAMEVEEIGDGETAIVRAVRGLVGARLPIAVSLDLHANLAPEVVRQAGIIAAYRTAPHRDSSETVLRAASLLVDSIARLSKPSSLMLKLPLLLGGESAVTEVEPARSLFARLPELDRTSGVLSTSILIGCAWTDSPFATVSVVVSGTDHAAMSHVGGSLAREIWLRRADFHIDSPCAEPAEAVRRASASERRPVFISDSGDNPTAGAAGDSPYMLELLVRRGTRGALVAGLADPEAVQRCFEAGAGADVRVSLGGKLDRVFARPYACEAKVLRLAEASPGDRKALVEIGGVHLVLQCLRSPFTELKHFATIGIDPAAYGIVVVKLGYLFPELRDYAPEHIMAMTPGFGDQRLERLPYRNLPRPVYPLDPLVEWEPPAHPSAGGDQNSVSYRG